MKKYTTIFLSFWVMMANPQLSEAKYITIETEATVRLEDDRAKVLVKITNKGDESAYNVKISTDTGGKILAGPLREELKANDPYSEEFSTAVEFKRPGKYPIVVTVDYTDQNQYPFTAISIVYLNYKESVVSRVIGEITATSITDSGTVKVKIKNLEQKEEKVNVRLVIPKELSSTTPAKEVILGPGLEQTVVFEIKNLFALPESNYQIYAVLEYEDDRYHFANGIGGSIKIEKKKTVLDGYQKPLIAIVILLTVAVVYFNLRRKEHRKG